MEQDELSWNSLLKNVNVSLKLLNSLTNEREIYIPQFQKEIHLYNYLPITYDSILLNNARLYISFDIIRRVLADYFKYCVCHTMYIPVLSAQIENDFFENMEKLNVKRSHVLICDNTYDRLFHTYNNELTQVKIDFKNYPENRYFLHFEPLLISEQTMSHLPRDITIKEALEYHTSRQIRIAFLLNLWENPFNYTPELLDKAIHYERIIKEFQENVKKALQNVSVDQNTFTELFYLKDLQITFFETKIAVQKALCDNIDTQTALSNLNELIKSSNEYIQNYKITDVTKHVLENILSYILEINKIFGLNFDKKRKLYR